MKKIKMKLPRHSIAWKLCAGMFLCLFLLLFSIWLLNNFVLVTYYQNVKKKALENEFDKLNISYNQNNNSLESELDRLNTESNIRVTIWNQSGEVYNSQIGVKGNFRFLPNVNIEKGTYEIGMNDDQKSGSNLIMLTGRFDNGYYVIMSTAVAAIEESVGITNRFLIISGIAALVISSVVILLYSRNFTRPIRELSRVAGSVARLDFSDRYTGNNKDELGELGNSINTMASALQETVSNLKTANLQLMNDYEQKSRQSEARRAFIANVSHELKTPISLIQTYAEGLKEDIAGGAENRDYYCEVIEDEANKMSTLIKKMTMLMQLEAGNEELVIERFDLTELITNLLIKNNPRFEQKKVTVTNGLTDPVYVWADEFLIENVLTNYISNALNHVNEQGNITVTFKKADNERVRISVYNSGNQIPKDDLPRIWESFYKVDKARTRAYGGTGIGLSVVAAIMKAHHMPYGVINHKDGVEFYIELECC